MRSKPAVCRPSHGSLFAWCSSALPVQSMPLEGEKNKQKTHHSLTVNLCKCTLQLLSVCFSPFPLSCLEVGVAPQLFVSDERTSSSPRCYVMKTNPSLIPQANKHEEVHGLMHQHRPLNSALCSRCQPFIASWMLPLPGTDAANELRIEPPLRHKKESRHETKQNSLRRR